MKDLQRLIDQKHAGHHPAPQTTTPEGSVDTAFKAEGYRSPPTAGRDPTPGDGKQHAQPAK